MLMVGLGGVFAEVFADTALAIAPVSPASARQLLLSLRAAPLLLGARGRGQVDLDALAVMISRVSHLATAHPELVSSSSTRSSPRARVSSPSTRGSCWVSRLDVAQVALVEAVHPGVLGREDPVVERT